VVASAIVGSPTSTIERVLIRARRRIGDLDAFDLATALDPFGYGLWFIEGHHDPPPLEVWLYDRDPRLFALIAQDAHGGPLHWIGCLGLALCDALTGGRWSRMAPPSV
jgi:hypothetical protein